VTNSNLLAIQDEISGRASAMIGSYWGAIGAAEYKRIQNKPSAELTPYECIVQGVIGIPTDATILEPVAKARACLERLTREEPRNAAAWAALVLVFNNQRTWGFPSAKGDVESVEKRLHLADMAVEAANRAVEIAPNDAFVRGLVARAAWMAGHPDLLRIETMRAIELNPNDPQNLGPLGNLMAYAGFWDEGVALAEKGIGLTTPSTPRWWWWALAKRAFAYGNYAEAFDAFRQSYVEQLWISHLHMAYTLPYLDRTMEAKAHAATLLRMRPGFTIREANAYYKMWCFAPSYREKMCDALRIAGLPSGGRSLRSEIAASGPLRHSAAKQHICRFRSEADMNRKARSATSVANGIQSGHPSPACPATPSRGYGICANPLQKTRYRAKIPVDRAVGLSSTRSCRHRLQNAIAKAAKRFQPSCDL